MNNQEVKQILSRLDQPENKFLQYVTRWTNSIMGMLSEIIALAITVSTVFYYDNMQEVIFNSILLIAGLYILLYEVFDFAALEYAITNDQSILCDLFTTSLFAFYVIFLNDGTKASLFANLFLLILMYIMRIIFYGIISQGQLFHIKFLYITNKCKYNK